MVFHPAKGKQPPKIICCLRKTLNTGKQSTTNQHRKANPWIIPADRKEDTDGFFFAGLDAGLPLT